MECSVTEDSSFGGGGAGSAGFSFSAAFVSFSWAPTGRASRKARANALRCRRFIICRCSRKARLRFGRRNIYVERERRVSDEGTKANSREHSCSQETKRSDARS